VYNCLSHVAVVSQNAYRCPSVFSMGDINHLYLVAKGGYENADLTEESWQCGIRLMPFLSDTGDIGAPPMAFDAVSDTLSGSATNWTSTSNFLCEGGVNDIDPADYVAGAGAAWQGFFEDTNAYICDDVTLTSVTLYAMGSDGKVINTDVGPAKAVAVPTSGVDGVNAGGLLPIQNSVVLSLRTPNTTRRGRGRIYLPGPTASILGGSDGLITTVIRGNIATAGKDLLNDLKTGTFGVDAVLRPVVIGSPYSTYFRVTQVKVGNVVDSQRRRRRNLTEAYSTVSL